MSGSVLLYGATGHSGMMLAAALADLGVDFERGLVVAARDAVALAPLAARLGVDGRAFGLDQPAAIDAALADIDIVLNCAGPFAATAPPMIAACLRTRTHYLDIAGEWPVFAAAQAHDAAAKAAGVMLLPGVGFAIAASDCLLALAAARVPDCARLRLAISRPKRVVRGSMATILGLNDASVHVMRQGRMVALPAGRLARHFDFGAGGRHAVAVTWPDVVTAAGTTGVDTVETYAEAGWGEQALIRLGAVFAPVTQAPGAAPWLRAASAVCAVVPAPAPEAAGFVLVAEAEDRWRRTTTVRLRTHDGHVVTTATAAAAVRRVLAGDHAPGFTTPARRFGADFITQFDCADLLDRAD